MPFLASEGCFWPPTASMTSEVKNNCAYVITQDICNKFIEINFCVACIVSLQNRLFQRSTTMSLINKILDPCFFQKDGSQCGNLTSRVVEVCKMNINLHKPTTWHFKFA